MFFDHEAAERAVSWAEECRLQWAHEDSLEPSDAEIRDLLLKVVEHTVKDSTEKGRPVTLGLSAGYDSRPMLWALGELGLKARTYTFGQIGNLDFDLARLLDDRNDLNNVFIDTSDVRWPLDAFVWAAAEGQDLPISPRVLAEQRLDDLFPDRIDLHGFLNGSLTGATQIQKALDGGVHEQSRAFMAKNDQFGFQQLFDARTLDALLLTGLPDVESPLSRYQKLDLGYRQFQRIRPLAGPSAKFRFPFEDERWVGLWLSRDPGELRGQRRWIRFVRSLPRWLFFDLDVSDDCDRGMLRRQRIALVYGDEERPAMIESRSSGKHVPRNPTQHFCLQSCYRNNPSFRAFVSSTIARLRSRRALTDTFVSDILRDFENGDEEAVKGLNGLLTIEFVLEAGRIETIKAP